MAANWIRPFWMFHNHSSTWTTIVAWIFFRKLCLQKSRKNLKKLVTDFLVLLWWKINVLNILSIVDFFLNFYWEVYEILTEFPLWPGMYVLSIIK